MTPRRCRSAQPAPEASVARPTGRRRRGRRLDPPPAHGDRRRGWRARRQRPSDRRPVDDEHRHGRRRTRRRSRSPGSRMPARSWSGSRSTRRKPRPPSRRWSARSAASAWTCRSSATSTTTATCCWRGTRRRRGCSRSTGSTRATSAAKRHDEHFQTIVRIAIENDKPVRIGVNWGSLDQQLLTELMDANARLAEPRDARDVMIEAMIESALRSAELAEAPGWRTTGSSCRPRCPASATSSRCTACSAANGPAAAPRPDRGGHGRPRGIVASTAGLAILLNEGIGDTIRVSLTPAPGGPRDRGGRGRPAGPPVDGPPLVPAQVSACPGCGRTTSTFFQEMARDIQTYLRDQMPVWRETHPGRRGAAGRRHGLRRERTRARASTPTSASRLPGTFEEPVAPVFVDGKLDRTLRGDSIVPEFLALLDAYIDRRFPTTARASRLSAGLGRVRPGPGWPAYPSRPRFGPGPADA